MQQYFIVRTTFDSVFAFIASKEVPYSSITFYTESLNAKVVSVIMIAPRLSVCRVETTLLGHFDTDRNIMLFPKR